MADDNKQPANNFASNTLVAGLLLVTGTAVYFQPAPLHGARPQVTETAISQSRAKEHIDARLWQDPFGAVAKWHRDQIAEDKKLSGQQKHCARQQCDSPLLQAPPTSEMEKTLVLAVTVSGSPYADSEEWRRRARYAVVAALGISGFAPQNSEKIGYWRPRDTQPDAADQEQKPAAEQKPVAESSKGQRRRYASAGPINGAGRSVAIPAAAVQRNAAASGIPGTSGAPSGPDACSTEPGRWADVAVPFEWFHSEDSKQRVLLLWINEDVLGDKPICDLSQLANRLDLEGSRKKYSSHKFELRVLGPESSSTLRAMVDECSKEHEKAKRPNKEQAKLLDATFYAYTPTAEDRELLGRHSEAAVSEASVRSSLKECSIDLYRTIAADNILANGIVRELIRRGVNPPESCRSAPVSPNNNGANCGPNTQHVVLVSEWDSFYGRQFPKTMQRAFLNEGKDHSHSSRDNQGRPEWLHKFSYLRGLDGRTAQEAEKKKDESGAAPSEKQQGLVEQITGRGDAKDDASVSERPDGQRQYDYLRRTAAELVSINNELQAHGKGSIKAIGVVGNDVYDKLLVLRALRSEFPGALFFTTDLDAALTMPSERTWTRNLIVASSFGLGLHRDIQSAIPPFRSNYETSAFLSARLAIREFGNIKEINGGLHEKLNQDWLQEARMFEVTRTGGALELGGQDEWTQQLHPCGALNGEPANPVDCKVIHAGPPPLFRQPPKSGNLYIGWTILAITILFLVTLFFRGVRMAALPIILVLALAGFSAAIISFWWQEVAAWLTDNGEGEPLTLDGASMWPTIILRALGIILSIGLLWQAFRKERENLKNVASRLGLPSPAEAVETMAKRDRRLPWLEQFKLMFLYRLSESQPDMANLDKEPFDLEKAWLRYVYSGRFTARLLRGTVFVGLMSILDLVLGRIFGVQEVFARGGMARGAYHVVTMLDVVFLQLLIFYVLDATSLTLSLVSKLSELTKWHKDTRTRYAAQLGFEHFIRADSGPHEANEKIVSVIDDWIDLNFIEQRTRCINQLIIYPFAVIALLLISRSTLFANHAPDVPLLITTAVSIIIALGCAMALPHAAERSRGFAKRAITDEIIRSKGLEDGRLSGQLEALLDRVRSLREGAFSPFYDQPVVRAMLLPLSTIGGTALLEFLALPGM
ncbi:MAG: hypothetical protein L0Y57_09805 [Beijerinckiaceae bacterium]|nr:hypothetical protein [Beijerinckiaceae bacterium]